MFCGTVTASAKVQEHVYGLTKFDFETQGTTVQNLYL